MRKLVALGMALAFALALFGCSSSNEAKDDTAKDSGIEQTEATQEKSKEIAKAEYSVGDTWEVPGQWKVTINSVTETDERHDDDFDDVDPAAVYIIDYTYENLGYHDEDFDSDLYVDPTMQQIVDAGGSMGYGYYALSIDYDKYPESVPIGAFKNAQESIGVDNPGDFKLIFTIYDNDSKPQKATFNCTVS